MEKVRAKKHLGQHFLTDESVAKRIADTLSLDGYKKVLEIGPGMGVLTKYILDKPIETFVVEIDTESVDYLNLHYEKLHDHIFGQDFLKFDIVRAFNQEPFAVIGNFPYNISSQIVFRVLELKDYVPEFSGMFQKEVAERICEKKGSKTYGILSVLTQAFYETEYLFTVSEHVFNPPPKVKSGVMRMRRKENYALPCSERLFFNVVKTAFNQRRKTLRNSLKSFQLPEEIREQEIFNLRPEQLGFEEFINITKTIEANGVQNL
ncbi:MULTISPECIES: 16S rRNA (adenine(1518)-N(6)/adenine(1519)-N(6))-dimethyltransferase RsmA [Myroides]|uniref:Ribosomal RNA small subunit methyltransferase A n=1 Tax=Myroides albus TaxID=2562892 RepID=A0A6I3LHG4_9FLAO|nr:MULTISPECIES: 16S rRNA (adenine(1518)-N(6)/adenine(1519)-N(6))-dimethyltransferase RsmA [Myroides]MTG97948.1 16S rRNA (adenine(1518)-N(6)/adenine(1519)-N(6))-dimethyltransferase RsmA [Myroides albus]MVX36413.1 16S rRNA (adenine(1518)-N(6)/adenine(1519)-N(6))-dimethyltransferase RsmA [Myroides sp. LoEW2-1]UVD81136.1 16S rRNA (adenine(1518)-N(6)/adenine(1519)-N(6))-dimethyltransferase RsmA [Myroides albus]